MAHEELQTVFEKIEDCDFDGAINEMYQLAKTLSENGQPEYSDFLASFASNSYQSNNLQQKTKPFSEINLELELLNTKYRELVQEIDSIIITAFEHFKKIEAIAFAENNPRPRFYGFNASNSDNYKYICQFIEGDETHISFYNVSEVFSNQLGFYARLQPSGVKSFGNIGGRITNIIPGQYWNYMELYKKFNSIKSSLDKIPAIELEISQLQRKANDLSGHYWINDYSSSGFREELVKSLNLFQAKQFNNR